jgi:hypothetical protein
MIVYVVMNLNPQNNTQHLGYIFKVKGEVEKVGQVAYQKANGNT